MVNDFEDFLRKRNLYGINRIMDISSYYWWYVLFGNSAIDFNADDKILFGNSAVDFNAKLGKPR